MKAISNLSIRWKLTLAVFLPTVLVLVVGGGLLMFYDYDRSCNEIQDRVEMLSQLLSTRGRTALAQGDTAAGESVVTSLAVEKNVLSACLYDAIERPFAIYNRNGFIDEYCPAHPGAGAVFGDEDLAFSGKILSEDGLKTVGILYIRYDLQELQVRKRLYAIASSCILVIGFAISIVISGFLYALIVTPLVELGRASESVAKGDLSFEIMVRSDDEVGVLAKSFNWMARQLHGLVTEVRRNIREVGRVSEELERTSRGILDEAKAQEAGIQETAEAVCAFTGSVAQVTEQIGRLEDSVNEVSSSIIEMDTSIGSIAANMDYLSETIETSSSSVVEMGANISQVAQTVESLDVATDVTEVALRDLTTSIKHVERDARRSHEISQKAALQAENGMDAVREVIDGINAVKSSFLNIEEVVSALAVKSDSIGEIIKVIDEVANQTDLLSLNAAIIASQAGEHGKAFAVVADHVKSLAERTARSTKEIAELIMSVQEGVANAVRCTNQGREHVQHGVGLSRAAGDALSEIIRGSHVSTQMVSGIVEATVNQVRDIEKVEGSVKQVKTMVAEINRSTHEQERASREISKLTEKVRDLGQEVKHSTQEQSAGSKVISNTVTRVAGLVHEIVSATEAQHRGSERIDHALKVFREVMGNSLERTESLATMVGTLLAHSQKLEVEIGRFELGGSEANSDQNSEV